MDDADTGTDGALDHHQPHPPPPYDPGKEDYAGISHGALHTLGDLHDARDFAEMIVDTVREGLLVLDFQLRVVAANESFYRAFAVRPEETVGRLVYDLGNGQWDVPELRELLEGVLPHRRAVDDFEVERDFERVGRRAVLLNARRLDDHQLILLALEDVTERRKSERALRASEERSRASEERFRALVNASSYAVYRMSPDWSEMQELDGRGFITDTRRPSEAWLDEYIHPDDQPEVRAAIGEAIRTGSPFELEHRVRRADGTLGWTLSRAVPLFDGAGGVAEWFGAATDITARKEAEEALRAGEHRYRALFESIDEGFSVIERVETPPGAPKDFRYVEVNPAFEQHTGLAAVVGRTIRDVVPEAEEATMEVYDRVATTGEPVRFEIYVAALDRWLDMYASRVDAERGRVAVVFNDVTDRKRAEAALRASEERYRTLFESIDEGFCVIEVLFDEGGAPVDYRFLETNPAFESQSGLVGAVGKRMCEMVPEHEAHWFEAYGRIALTGEPERFAMEAEHLGGRWFDVYAFHVGDPEERRVAVLFNDDTERKRAEQALQESEARYRALFHQAPAVIVMLRGPEHRFEFVNPAYLRLVGDRELLGKTVREALPEVEGQGLFEALDRVYASGEPFTAVERPVDLQRSGGGAAERRYADFVYTPLLEPDGSVSGVIAIGVDTTERVRARAERDRVQRELEEANRELERRVEARTGQVRRLASKLSVAEQEERRRIAHVLHDDLQQQLFGVSIALALWAGAASPEERARHAERAGQTLAEATKLTRTLSTELSPAVLESDRLGEMLRWLAVQQREAHGLVVEVEGDADVGTPVLRVLLYHVVREVLFNVAKHAGTDSARVVIEGVEGHVAVRIEDEGAGFDPAALEGGGGAVGFGLASIRERLELIGGRLEVASAVGRGTRVTVTVPVRPA